MGNSLRRTRERLVAARPTSDLIAVEPCLVPVSRLHLVLLTVVDLPLPVLEEFLLRFVAAGTTQMSRVAATLGLTTQELVVPAANQQRQGNLRLSWVRGEGVRDAELELSSSGQDIARELSRRTVEKFEHSLVFDRLIWKIAPERDAQLLDTRRARESGQLVLPAMWTRAPRPEDMSVDEVDRHVRRTRAGAERGVLSIESLSVENRYIGAELAIYRSRISGEIELDVWVRERLDEARSSALAAAGGAEALGISVDAAEPLALDDLPVAATDVLTGQEPFTSAEAEAAASVQQLSARISAVDAAEWSGQRQVPPSADPEGEFRSADAEDVSELRRLLQQATEELRAARGERTFRRLDTFDHPELLQSALRTSAVRMLIISPWITGKVVNKQFLERLEQRCAAGVRIHIGHGIGPADQEDEDPEARAAIESLSKLSERFDNFTFQRLGDTHAKVLIWDDSWVCTSFNWLSFVGDARRRYRQEEGVLIRDPGDVAAQYAQMVARFDDGRSAGVTALSAVAREILDLAAQGESKVVEFKSSARYNLHTKQRDEEIEHAIVKTIAAFLNSDGGHLLIGVNDEGAVVGLENDYKLLGRRDHDPRDKFENWLTGLVDQQLGGGTFHNWGVRFERFPAGDVCLVTVRPSSVPVYLTRGDSPAALFVRANNTSRSLGADEILPYWADRFVGAPSGGINK